MYIENLKKRYFVSGCFVFRDVLYLCTICLRMFCPKDILTQNVLSPMMFCFRTFRPGTRILHTGATLVICILHSEAAPVVRKLQTRAVPAAHTSTQGHFQLAYPIQGQLLQLSAHSIQGQLQLPAYYTQGWHQVLAWSMHSQLQLSIHFTQGSSSCPHMPLRSKSSCPCTPLKGSSSCPYTPYRDRSSYFHPSHSAVPVVHKLHSGQLQLST